ncbi:MAG: N-acetylmuramoyl-L-alanine amidase [Gemmatimonadaceae bacterium]
MIGTVLIALQLVSASTATPMVLTVRGAGSETSVSIARTNGGAAVAIGRLAPAFPLTVRSLPNGHFIVSTVGIELDVIPQVPFIRANGAITPLAAAPFLDGGELFVPFQVLADLMPRVAPAHYRYSAERGEFRQLDGAAGSGVALPPARSGTARATGTAPRPDKRGRARRVVVDAGHGGPDNGMSGPIGTRWKILEKDITLAVAKKVATTLRRRGVDVVMTRTADTLIALSDRGRIANDRGGDLFISIHVNAANMRWSSPQNARGFETYFLAEARTEDARRVARMENESVRFETAAAASRDDPLSFIINDMAQNEHLRESSELAEMMQDHLLSIHPGPNRGVKQAGFRVLVTAFMPAVLVEIGFGTNADEARYLTDARRQTEIAEALAAAAAEYLDRYQRRLGTGGR